MTLESIKKFCASKEDDREYLHQPCVVGDYVYATNGKVLAREPIMPSTNIPPNEGLAEKLDGVIKSYLAAPMQQHKTTLRTPQKSICQHCNGVGKVFDLTETIRSGIYPSSFFGEELEDIIDRYGNGLLCYADVTPPAATKKEIKFNIEINDDEFSDDDIESETSYSCSAVISDEIWEKSEYWDECNHCQGEGSCYPSPYYGYSAQINQSIVEVGALALALEYLGNDVYLSANTAIAKSAEPVLLSNDDGVMVMIMPMVRGVNPTKIFNAVAPSGVKPCI